MSPSSVKEYGEAVRGRYLRGSRAEKRVILDEFCLATGYTRKAVIRLLHREPRAGGGRRGRPVEYGVEVGRALKQVWEASGRICSKRLRPFMEEMVEALERGGRLKVEPQVRAGLLEMSEATMDRLLKPFRSRGLRQPSTGSQALAGLRGQVPVRTFGEWQGVAPGSLQADLVAHCGESTEGFYLHTLLAVDVATSWSALEATWGRGQERVRAGVHRMRGRMLFPWRELHTDNGGEFLNYVLYPYCQQEGIRCTRGRPYKKNDQAYAEQRNWSLVRKVVGYDRFSSKAALEALGQVYKALELYVNFFQPVRKLVAKERVGAKVLKRYDKARTPHQRLSEAGVLSAQQSRAMQELYEALDPVQLQGDIQAALEKLWSLAERTPKRSLIPANLVEPGNTHSDAPPQAG